MRHSRFSLDFLARLFLQLALACALTGIGPAVAADGPEQGAAAQSAAIDDGADLTLLNRHVVRFRGKLLGATPQQRAVRGERNLAELLQRGDDTITVKPTELGNIVLIGGQMAFVLSPDDTDKLAGQTLAALTDATLARLRIVVGESRESRDSEALLKGLGFALAETGVALALAFGLARLRGWAGGRLVVEVDRRAGSLKLAGTELIRRERILSALSWLVNAVYWLLLALLANTWLGLLLARFPYTRVWGEQLNGYLLGVVAHIGGGILGALPDLLIVGLTFLIARSVVGLLKPLFDHVATGEAGTAWLDQDTVEPTRKIANILIWIFALVMAYPYLPGAQTEAFKGMSVLIGLMVSLGASSIVGQGASGLILMYSRTLRSGEYVRIGDHEGTIASINLFTTRLRTGRGAEITLPNALIVGSATRNYSRTANGRGFMIDTTVTIGYDTPWRQVEAMLVEAALRTSGILPDPAPRVFQTALSDFYPEYCLVAQATPVGANPRADILSRLHANIQDVFNEYGVQIMSPHYIDDPANEKVVPPSRWFTPPAKTPRP
ncbi:MAG: mechanosensitive ion channel family protein [Zoogloea sp.]|nr:mechanosensitive ion channel family protein [Zoogloea sp.]